ncbi:MAG: metallophosphoesterase [Gemmatimonadetes bacterium]|nr:metallophosphoesterase [Gemmatimonadota bacterium]
MKRWAWTTDIHLNFLEVEGIEAFVREIISGGVDGLLIGGDIGEAPNVVLLLRFLEDRLQRPIYFVLGNHDFYRGSIAGVRREVSELAAGSPWLHYLSRCGPVELTAETALIGHDGWADGRLGEFARSRVELNDYWLIEELRDLDAQARLRKLNELGDEAAGVLEGQLAEALHSHQHAIVLTHVPPFRGACWHEGEISNDDYLPHFSCRAVGEVLEDVMARLPEKRVTVLCGHTHGAGEAQIRPNLQVKTGGAVYGRPEVTEWLSVP